MTTTTNEDPASKPNGKPHQDTSTLGNELTTPPSEEAAPVPAVAEFVSEAPPDPEDAESEPSVFDFLSTENGKTLGLEAFKVLGAWIAATKGAEAEVRKSQTELQAKQMEHRVSAHRWVLATQMAGLGVVIGAIVLLSLKSLLTPEAGTLLGAVAGYLFGRRSADSPA